MLTSTDYRIRAATCRRASSLGKRPALYLLEMAAYYDRCAAQIDASFAGQKPGPLQAYDMKQEKARR